MKKGRLEAFSDGVLAIIITIMVLEIKVPAGYDLKALLTLYPIFLSYLLSFIYIGIYWMNHHHMLTAIDKVSGIVLWANLHLLFWISLIPFATRWAGESNFAPITMSLYGFILLMAAMGYFILQRTLIRRHGHDSILSKAVGRDLKGKLSCLFYLIAIPSAFISSWISGAIYILVALMWFIPDKRIEQMLNDE